MCSVASHCVNMINYRPCSALHCQVMLIKHLLKLTSNPILGSREAKVNDTHTVPVVMALKV